MPDELPCILCGEPEGVDDAHPTPQGPVCKECRKVEKAQERYERNQEAQEQGESK